MTLKTMKYDSLKPIPVKSLAGDYQVEFRSGINETIQSYVNHDSVFVVCDRNVASLYANSLAAVTDKHPTFYIDAQESSKTLEGISSLVTWLQMGGANRKSTLLAIGGGIVQDICAFTSHIYFRGINWIFFPTTLLAMCDSCIGAKCGINHNQFKNQIGVFHAPRRIYVLFEFLETLNVIDIKSGYGEILKLLLTGDFEDFKLLETCLADTSVGLLGEHLPTLIHRSLEIKREVIEDDEFEVDRRRILNFGHTFGHSLETLSDYEVPHGLAVAWGIDLVNHIAFRKGMISSGFFERISRLIRTHFNFEMQYKPSLRDLIDGTKKDKKVESGQINLVLLNEAPLCLQIVPQRYDVELTTWVQEYLEKPHAFARY